MPLPDVAPDHARRLMRDDAYDALCALIVDGTLQPGETLRDKEIAAWLGVSRTPVREALGRLADDGLVTSVANRFTRVTQLEASVAGEAHDALALIDGELAASLAGADGGRRTASARELQEAAERFAWALWRNDVDEALGADAAVHAALRGENPTLTGRVAERLEPLTRRAQRAAWPAIHAAWPAEQHATLVAAVEQADIERARGAAAGEWRALADLVRRALSR